MGNRMGSNKGTGSGEGPRRTSKNNPGRFDFLAIAKQFAVVSAVLSVLALANILITGFNFGIDFAGGTEVQVQFQEDVDVAQVRQFTNELGFQNASVQSFGDEHEFLIRLGIIEGETDEETQALVNETIQKITSALTSFFSSEGPVIRRVDSVGPQIGAELKRNGLLAMFYSLLLVLFYIGMRFDYKFAPGAVFCLFHDAIITLGIFALFRIEVNVQTLAAILTLIGYSLNDTIVVFDRIRENLSIYRDEKFSWVVNRSLNDTLSRTLLTTTTTMLAILALYFIAGGVIQDFAFTLAIGLVLGTYSTIYVAAPIVIWLDRLEERKKALAAAAA